MAIENSAKGMRAVWMKFQWTNARWPLWAATMPLVVREPVTSTTVAVVSPSTAS